MVLNEESKYFVKALPDEREEEYHNLSTETDAWSRYQTSKANFRGKTALTEPSAITLQSVKVWYPEM